MKRRENWLQGVYGRGADFIAVTARKPGKAGVIAALFLTSICLVCTSTLPVALAGAMPELALKLQPDHPGALLVLAERARAKLLTLPPSKGGTGADLLSSARGSSGVGPGSADSADTVSAQRQPLRAEIRKLAQRVIAADRLNAQAFRLLAEVSDGPGQMRALMEEAAKRSRREPVAVFWLMNDSLARKNPSGVVENADVLLRTRRQLESYVWGFLGEAAAMPEGRVLLTNLLTRNPPWRPAFFVALPRNVRTAGTPLDLMLAMKETESPPSASELAPYLNFLVSRNLAGFAYDAWLQFLPPEKLKSLGLLNNPAFTADPGGLPFDWQIGHGMNAIVEFVPLRDGKDSRALKYSFGGGRVKFPETGQVIMLAPGRYRFSGDFQGMITAKRGLRWQVRCVGAGDNLIAETEMIHGHPRLPQSFALDVVVPPGPDCKVQRLRVFHDSRSPSEELVSGEIAFRDLSLSRVGNPG